MDKHFYFFLLLSKILVKLEKKKYVWLRCFLSILRVYLGFTLRLTLFIGSNDMTYAEIRISSVASS
jgi:hypothetical protein